MHVDAGPEPIRRALADGVIHVTHASDRGPDQEPQPAPNGHCGPALGDANPDTVADAIASATDASAESDVDP